MSAHRWQRIRAYLRVPVLRSGLLVSLLAALVAVATIWGDWLPAQDRQARANAHVIALTRAIAGTEARLALTDRYLELTAQVDRFEALLRTDIDRSQLVERMTALAAAAGTRIIHGANSFGQPRAGFVPVIQDLTVEGAYEDVREFLDLVSDLETFSLLLSAEISANPDGTLVRGKLRFMTVSEENA